jgi:AraC-like DNA-binding protein
MGSVEVDGEPMAGLVPLIRSGSMMPIVRWMRANGRPVEDRLRAVHLSHVLKGDPNLPIPLTQALAFLRNASEAEGPDFPMRAVSSQAVADLGLIGRIALAGGSVRDALARVADALPVHISHETITVRPVPEGVIVREAWSLRMDEDTRHFVQQYFAALIHALCANGGARRPMFRRVALVPHPVHGLAHLRRWFGDALEASPDKTLELLVPSRVADRVLPASAPEVPGLEGPGRFPAVYGDGKLSTLVRNLLPSLFDEELPTVGRVAAATGYSIRTFQRRLDEEHASFSLLLEEVRRDLALAALSTGDMKIGDIAGQLGYEQHSSFTRAVHRWTGTSPRGLAGDRRR